MHRCSGLHARLIQIRNLNFLNSKKNLNDGLVLNRFRYDYHRCLLNVYVACRNLNNLHNMQFSKSDGYELKPH